MQHRKKAMPTQGKINTEKKEKKSAMQLLCNKYLTTAQNQKKNPTPLVQACLEKLQVKRKKYLALQNTEQKHAMDTQRDAQISAHISTHR
jgi:hypothetical protein